MLKSPAQEGFEAIQNSVGMHRKASVRWPNQPTKKMLQVDGAHRGRSNPPRKKKKKRDRPAFPAGDIHLYICTRETLGRRTVGSSLNACDLSEPEMCQERHAMKYHIYIYMLLVSTSNKCHASSNKCLTSSNKSY